MLNGMQQMLAGMLKEAIPEEVQALLTPEKMKELGDKVTAFITDVRERLDRIESNQAFILAELAMIKDTPDNDGRNDSNEPDTGTRGRRSNRKSTGTDSN